MSEIIWPPSLPSRPTKTDYSDILPGNSLTFEMDTGPSKSWRVSSSSPGFRELAYILREVSLQGGVAFFTPGIVFTC